MWPVSPSLGLTFSFKILRNHGLFLETRTESGVSSSCDPCVQTHFTHFYEFSFSSELEAVVEGQGKWEECGRHREAGCGGKGFQGPRSKARDQQARRWDVTFCACSVPRTPPCQRSGEPKALEKE